MIQGSGAFSVLLILVIPCPCHPSHTPSLFHSIPLTCPQTRHWTVDIRIWIKTKLLPPSFFVWDEWRIASPTWTWQAVFYCFAGERSFCFCLCSTMGTSDDCKNFVVYISLLSKFHLFEGCFVNHLHTGNGTHPRRTSGIEPLLSHQTFVLHIK